MSQGRVPCHQDRMGPAASVDVVVVGVGDAVDNGGVGAGGEAAVSFVVVEGLELLVASTSQTWH